MADNPTISRKTSSTLTITDNAKKLFQIIYSEKTKAGDSDDIPKIKVSELISKMAFYYEKIRNSVDYKEEYLLRKNAIERILKRQLFIESSVKDAKTEEVARHLLVELIRAAYLPNDTVPETKIEEIAQTISKYLKLRTLSLSKMPGNNGEKKQIEKWILALAASDIEERLSADLVTQKIVSDLYQILTRNIRFPEQYKKDKEIQIYIGIHRVYLKFDRDMLEFQLLKYFIADWSKANSEQIAKVASNLASLRLAIDKQINHPLLPQLNKVINQYTAYYNILDDMIEDDPVKVYEDLREDPAVFKQLIKKFCQRRYKIASGKLRRAAVRSIIYIFLTKMILAIILEVPVTLWFGEVLNYTSLAINISFPPLLLFMIVLFTRVPGDANTAKIVQGIEEIVYNEKQRSEPYQLRQQAKRSRGVNAVFGLLYTITFFLSFGFVVWFLDQIHFTFVSILIFLFFLTLVSFFGIRIRKVAREMFIVEHKDNIINLAIDFFFVPVVAVGKWLNEKFSRINFFVFILDFIIEAPFKIFVDIAEDWTKYVRERKEEII